MCAATQCGGRRWLVWRWRTHSGDVIAENTDNRPGERPFQLHNFIGSCWHHHRPHASVIFTASARNALCRTTMQKTRGIRILFNQLRKRESENKRDRKMFCCNHDPSLKMQLPWGVGLPPWSTIRSRRPPYTFLPRHI